MRELDPLDLVETIREGLLVLDARIPGLAAGWSKPLRDSSAVRSNGRAATREPSCV
jgi:hypothetical protein